LVWCVGGLGGWAGRKGVPNAFEALRGAFCAGEGAGGAAGGGAAERRGWGRGVEGVRGAWERGRGRCAGMKAILSTRWIEVPKGVSVVAESREVTVKGPKGTLKKSFKHARVDIDTSVGKRRVKVEMWTSTRKVMASLRSVCSAIENMITGVTKGFIYKMRLAYNHFPINVSVEKGADGNIVEVRNFLGEKIVARVPVPAGVNIIKTGDVKDQLEITGINVDDVSQTAASIHQSCMVKVKDIRKFLDGIYVSEKGSVGKTKLI
jgi:large subunit ribosomal protein L9e